MANGAQQQNNGFTLHFEFVGMLFALAIAQVAVEAAELVASQTANNKTFGEFLPGYAHLFLATTVIAASWVGWGSSESSKSPVKHIFSFDYLELLVDVFLVVCYFIIVRSVESPDSSGNLTPSAGPEALWTMIILVTYFVWDLMTKAADWKRLLQRGWASLVCAGVSVLAFVSLPTSSVDHVSVLVTDGSLLILVVLFRAMKLDDFTKLRYWHILWIALAIAFVVALVVANRIAPRV